MNQVMESLLDRALSETTYKLTCSLPVSKDLYCLVQRCEGRYGSLADTKTSPDRVDGREKES